MFHEIAPDASRRHPHGAGGWGTSKVDGGRGTGISGRTKESTQCKDMARRTDRCGLTPVMERTPERTEWNREMDGQRRRAGSRKLGQRISRRAIRVRSRNARWTSACSRQRLDQVTEEKTYTKFYMHRAPLDRHVDASRCRRPPQKGIWQTLARHESRPTSWACVHPPRRRQKPDTEHWALKTTC